MAEPINLYDYVTDSGVIIPDTEDVKSLVEESYRSIFGASMDLTEESVGGRIVERETTAIAQTIGVTAQNANQFNPNYATGIYLDYLASMFGVSRNQPTKTRVYAKVFGKYRPESPVVITTGSQAQTVNGDTFEAEADITIGVPDGFAYGWFVATVAGSIPCGVGELNSIQSYVDGWNGITNENSSVSTTNPTVIGLSLETDDHLRRRLLTSVWSGVGFVKSIEARVNDVDGVKSSVVLENNTSKSHLERGVNIPPHSVFIGVDGGVETNIANAIYASRSAGCGYCTEVIDASVPPTSIGISDPYNGIVHNVYFQRPITRSLNVSIKTKNGRVYDKITKSIQNAITDYLSELGIGNKPSDYEMASYIVARLPLLGIESIEIANQETEVPAYRKYFLGTLSVS